MLTAIAARVSKGPLAIKMDAAKIAPTKAQAATLVDVVKCRRRATASSPPKGQATPTLIVSNVVRSTVARGTQAPVTNP